MSAMSKPVAVEVEKIRAALDKSGEALTDPADWFELLGESQAMIECMIDCYKEEHPEDFG